MQLSKRQFLKLGLGGTAACVLAPLFKPVSLLASPLVTPPGYLNSAVHSYWMRLSYNGGRESRKVRRTVGAALRNIGAIKGAGGGFNFTLSFDKAVESAFVRWAGTRQKPDSLFGLVDMLYNDFVYPDLGPGGGRAMFATLLAILRGQDGTSLGSEAHQAYLAYRDLALRYKYAAGTAEDPAVVEELRKARKAALENWRTEFLMLVDGYATKKTQLDARFLMTGEMTKGVYIYVNPDQQRPARLGIKPNRGQIIVDWKGKGLLQEAPTPSGPWTNTRKAPPTALDANGPRKFFRTISDNLK